MNAYDALKSLGALQPGFMLDVGTRDFWQARIFAEEGFQVHAIDPNPIKDPKSVEGITFEQTTLEEFEPKQTFELVAASFVSHLVSYETSEFLERLKSLTEEKGVIFVTLLGDQDGWANQHWARAVDLTTARNLVASAGLKVLFVSTERYAGYLYDGTPKFWYVLKFVLSRDN